MPALLGLETPSPLPVLLQLTGYLYVPEADTWFFSLASDGGSRLWLDGSLVVDNGGVVGAIVLLSRNRIWPHVGVRTQPTDRKVYACSQWRSSSATHACTRDTAAKLLCSQAAAEPGQVCSLIRNFALSMCSTAWLAKATELTAFRLDGTLSGERTLCQRTPAVTSCNCVASPCASSCASRRAPTKVDLCPLILVAVQRRLLSGDQHGWPAPFLVPPRLARLRCSAV